MRRPYGLRPRKVQRPMFWFARSRGNTKLKRVLYFVRYPIGRTISAEFLD